MEEIQNTNPAFINDMRNIILDARNSVVRSAEYVRMMMYWNLGERIFVEEQGGRDRAVYGENLLQNIAVQLETEFGSGFSYRQLAYCRKFYRLYPSKQDLQANLNWFQYRLLSSIDDDNKREQV